MNPLPRIIVQRLTEQLFNALAMTRDINPVRRGPSEVVEAAAARRHTLEARRGYDQLF